MARRWNCRPLLDGIEPGGAVCPRRWPARPSSGFFEDRRERLRELHCCRALLHLALVIPLHLAVPCAGGRPWPPASAWRRGLCPRRSSAAAAHCYSPLPGAGWRQHLPVLAIGCVPGAGSCDCSPDTKRPKLSLLRPSCPVLGSPEGSSPLAGKSSSASFSTCPSFPRRSAAGFSGLRLRRPSSSGRGGLLVSLMAFSVLSIFRRRGPWAGPVDRSSRASTQLAVALPPAR